MKIGKHDIKKKILVVAEIGNNHEGNISVAKRLIRLAAKVGADAVKFQTFITEDYVSKSYDPDRFRMLEKFRLSFDQFLILKNYTRNLGLIFISTPFDLNSAIFLNSIVQSFKVSSSDLNFYPLLNVISKTNKPIIPSTGISDMNDITKSLNYIKKFRNLSNIVIMHCVSSYPTMPKDVNLNNISSLKKIIKFVGYSDHTIGIDAALCAVALGARVIEKHFTLDNSYSSFKDHQISSNPEEFSKLLKKIRLYESMFGKKEFKNSIMKPKSGNIKRSISINTDLSKGSIIKKKYITWVRPAKGILPGNEKKIIGKKTKINISRGTLLKMKFLVNK